MEVGNLLPIPKHQFLGDHLGSLRNASIHTHTDKLRSQVEITSSKLINRSICGWSPLENYAVCESCLRSEDDIEQEPARASRHANTTPAYVCSDTAAQKEFEEELCKPLDNCLDYILKFLEGGHAKSHTLPEQTRSRIMSHVKSTLKWKMEGRTQKEIDERVNDLSAMMVQIVNEL